jgi:hypothetical protein
MTEAADVAVRRVREAAYPLIFRLFGSEMPRGTHLDADVAVGLGMLQSALLAALDPVPSCSQHS